MPEALQNPPDTLVQITGPMVTASNDFSTSQSYLEQEDWVEGASEKS